MGGKTKQLRMRPWRFALLSLFQHFNGNCNMLRRVLPVWICLARESHFASAGIKHEVRFGSLTRNSQLFRAVRDGHFSSNFQHMCSARNTIAEARWISFSSPDQRAGHFFSKHKLLRQRGRFFRSPSRHALQILTAARL